MSEYYFLLIDEHDSSLWKVPEASLASAELGGINVIDNADFVQHVLPAKRDNLAFFNAEMIETLVGLPFNDPVAQSLPRPSHKFHGATPGTFVLANCIRVLQSAWSGYGAPFLWLYSFESHNAAQRRLDVGPFDLPVEPARAGRLSSVRPSPQSLRGAARVTDFAKLTASERDFYLSVPVAPVLFYDCALNLEKYWRTTRSHKEAAPQRVAFKTRLRRDSERRKVENVSVLLEKAADPLVERNVVENARHGLLVLTELNNSKRAMCWGDDRTAQHPPDFFGPNGLPMELQSLVVRYAVEGALANPSPRESTAALSALRLTSSQFCKQATLLADLAVLGAVKAIRSFVLDAESLSPERALRPASWTYREFGTSPHVLAHRIANSRRVALELLRARKRDKLSEGVCRERGVVRREAAGPPPRLRRLVFV